MTSYKRIDGDYYITTINPGDKVYIQSDEVDVAGNLTVSGNLTYINVTELNVTDPFILVNASNTGTYSSNSGLLTHKTSSDYAGIRYNANSDAWELSTSTGTSGTTGTWSPIVASGSIAAGANTEIQYNDGGALGANAAFKFDYATSRLTVGGTVALGYKSIPPDTVANSATLVANVPGGGATGLYFNNNGSSDELISKTQAIVYSLIF
jgi:hypothetical protein